MTLDRTRLGKGSKFCGLELRSGVGQDRSQQDPEQLILSPQILAAPQLLFLLKSKLRCLAGQEIRGSLSLSPPWSVRDVAGSEMRCGQQPGGDSMATVCALGQALLPLSSRPFQAAGSWQAPGADNFESPQPSSVIASPT